MRPGGSASVVARLVFVAMLAFFGSFPATGVVQSFDPGGPAPTGGLTEKISFGTGGPPLPGKAPGGAGGKVEGALKDLVAEHARFGAQGVRAKADHLGLVARDDSVLVVVEGIEGAEGRLRGFLESRGGSVTSSSGEMVQVFLPLAAIDEVAALPEVKRVRRPLLPTVDYTSEGVGVINAAAWQTLGLNGSGVKIGIIDAGFTNYNALLGSELPPADRVHAQSFYKNGDITGEGEIHGTAVFEIIYDIAPAAHYYIANIYSDVDFGNAVDWMIANGVQIVSVSLGWAGANNYDGQGFLADKVDAARAAGIFWSNSAGNQARRHWEGWFGDSNGNTWHNFAPDNEGNGIYVQAGASIYGALTWNDSWSNPATDYDFALVRSDGVIVAASAEWQGPGVPPSEVIYWVANQPGTYFFAIQWYSGPTTRYMDLYTYRQDLQYQVAASSLIAPADAAGAMAVGAFYYGSGNIEGFSSQGPSNDGRSKPEFATPDGVSTYTYIGAGYGAFYGTSAAAPHLAGAAALVKQAYPSYTPAQIQSYLEARAVDAGSSGRDSVYGSGRLHLGDTPPPLLNLGVTSLYFLADDQWPSSSQAVPIFNTGWSPLNWNAQEWSGGSSFNYPWLSLSSGSGSAPASLLVAVDRSQIAKGSTVTGQIRVDGTSSGTLNTPQYVNVTFKYSSQPLKKVFLAMALRNYSASW